MSSELKEVKKFIANFKKEHSIIPLFLVESGSRMWEFASPDSDFDIRGVHITSLHEELSFEKIPEQLEHLEDLMDVVSYNINKYFVLLSSSNPNLLEQMQSKIIYESKWKEYGVDYTEFKEKVFSLVNLKSLFHHYINMAHNNYDKYLASGNKFTYKKALYVLRSLFCAKYIIDKKQVPPVVFTKVIADLKVEEKYVKFISEVLEKKSKSEEKTVIPDPSKISNLIEDLFGKIEQLEPQETGNKLELREYLNTIAVQIKKRAYLQ